ARGLPVGDAVQIGVAQRARSGENREPRGGDDVSRPIATRKPGAGRVDGPPFKPEGDSLANEQPVSNRTVHGVIGEGVAWSIAEFEPGVAAEDIQEVVLVTRVEHQTAARQRRGRVGAPGIGCRLLVTQFELDADAPTEKVAEPSAAADLLAERERAVIASVRAERADLELVRVLTDAEDWND